MQKATVTEKIQLTDMCFQLTFKVEESFKHKAGQYVSIKIADVPDSICFRAYSIASAQTDSHHFELCIKVVPNGRGSNWLNSLEINDGIEFLGPLGELGFDDSKSNHIFISTGTGVSPFRAIIYEELKKGNTQPLHLISGFAEKKDELYKECLEELKSKYPNFTYDIVIKDYVTTIIEKLDIASGNTNIYLCGNPAMIENTTTLLKEKGLPAKALHLEKY